MIRKGLLAIFITVALASPVLASSGSSSKPLAGTYPIILSHGLFGWGETPVESSASSITGVERTITSEAKGLLYLLQGKRQPTQTRCELLN